MKYPYREYVSVFKALADETSGELCACNILEEFNITQPTLSYHMKILTECGLVKGVKEGSWMKYTINNERLEIVKDIYEDVNKNR